MQALAVLAALMVVWVGTVYIRVWVPLGWTLVLPRLMAAALLPALVPMAVVFAAISVWLNSNLAAWLFMAVVITAGVAWLRIDAVPCDFGMAFGPNWDARVAPEHQPNLRRRAWRWRLPAAARVTWKRDIPFWTIPETGRVLLCDIWLPPAEVTRSGLAYVYFHGSTWCMLDKDFLTRSIFRHLAAQGHVVMDVAYRLCPETDIPGMVSDVNRAVAWIKEHANEYGVSADRIVVGGSSAGGQISLLAAYGAGVPEFTPPDVQGRDLSVRGVVSCYGPTDLAVCFYHTRQDRIHGIGLTPPDMKTLTSDSGRLGFVKAKASGRLDWIVGGTPDQVPERYALCSPVSHVKPGLPPTLLIQGEDDLVTQASATRELAVKLKAAGVPVVTLFFPHVTHAFDLAFPGLSPAARRALLETERFLAVLAQ
jgi:acetyl esterase/lipase